MTVYSILTKKKIEDGESGTHFWYSRTETIVDFKFNDLALEDILYMKRILQEAEDEILAQFIGNDPEPEGKVI